jgi:DNA-binding NarL/FixJ family response regulator
VVGLAVDLDSLLQAVAGHEPDAALDPEVVAHLLGRPRAGGPLDELNERERTVLSEMAEGRSNQAIAARLFLSDRAVERHVTAIFSKLRLTATRTRTGASRRSSPICGPERPSPLGVPPE